MHSVLNWPQNSANAAQDERFISLTSRQPVFILLMSQTDRNLRRLAEGGNTVVVIEHNLDVIKTADYIIDVGPEGGARGGTIVACGTPEEIAENPNSYTGIYVRKFLERDK